MLQILEENREKCLLSLSVSLVHLDRFRLGKKELWDDIWRRENKEAHCGAEKVSGDRGERSSRYSAVRGEEFTPERSLDGDRSEERVGQGRTGQRRTQTSVPTQGSAGCECQEKGTRTHTCPIYKYSLLRYLFTGIYFLRKDTFWTQPEYILLVSKDGVE